MVNLVVGTFQLHHRLWPAMSQYHFQQIDQALASLANGAEIEQKLPNVRSGNLGGSSLAVPSELPVTIRLPSAENAAEKIRRADWSTRRLPRELPHEPQMKRERWGGFSTASAPPGCVVPAAVDKIFLPLFRSAF
jgi:hypothetical protein